MINHQTQLFHLTISLHNVSKKNYFQNQKNKVKLIGGPPPAQPAKCHHLTSLSKALSHTFADTNPSMPNIRSEACYMLPCCYSSSCCSCSCCYLQAPAKIAARWRYRPFITNPIAHYSSQFCVSFYFCSYLDAPKPLQTCLNGA